MDRDVPVPYIYIYRERETSMLMEQYSDECIHTSNSYVCVHLCTAECKHCFATIQHFHFMMHTLLPSSNIFNIGSYVYNIPYLVECTQQVRKYIYIYIFVHVFLNYIYMCKYITLFFIYTTSHHMMQYCNKLCSYGTTSTNAVSHGATQYCKILVHIVFHFCTTCLPSINKING